MYSKEIINWSVKASCIEEFCRSCQNICVDDELQKSQDMSEIRQYDRVIKDKGVKSEKRWGWGKSLCKQYPLRMDLEGMAIVMAWKWSH